MEIGISISAWHPVNLQGPKVCAPFKNQCLKFRLHYFKEDIVYRVNGFPGQTRRTHHPVESCISTGKWTPNTNRAQSFPHRCSSRRKAGACDEDREGPSYGRLTATALSRINCKTTMVSSENPPSIENSLCGKSLFVPFQCESTTVTGRCLLPSFHKRFI